jgi:LysM repeat protein
LKELKSTLGSPAYARLTHWVESQWRIERKLHGSAHAPSSLRTYRIFATRYDSNGAYTVALPDKCLKFANGGSHICDGDGYVVGAGYTVFISYESSTAAVVGESGPWNVDDNFWATTSDPTPRRMFADLALGMPEAQAAYFNGYNGGVDQFGREVTAPFGIDLARQVSIDIGLEPGKNDWIDVSFMWTEGWDGGSGSNPSESEGTAQAQPTRATIIPIQVSEANPDGSVVHEVKEGQTLWNIAAAYQVNLSEVLRLNGMSEGSLIYPGQKLLIKAASFSPTPTSSSTAELTQAERTEAEEPSATPRPSRTPAPRNATPVAQAVPTLKTAISTDHASPAVSMQASDPMARTETDPFLMAIGGLALAGIALFLVGQLFSRK